MCGGVQVYVTDRDNFNAVKTGYAMLYTIRDMYPDKFQYLSTNFIDKLTGNSYVREGKYTLEELFRHEFTHYLQGRYVVPGMWGQGEFYQEGVLTWYEEGTAEFFAGSTRTDGIKPRKSVTQGLAYDRNNRMSLYGVLHAKYGHGISIIMDLLYQTTCTTITWECLIR